MFFFFEWSDKDPLENNRSTGSPLMRIIDFQKNFHLFKFHGKWLNKRRKKKLISKRKMGRNRHETKRYMPREKNIPPGIF